jgi:hypothetical protein
MFIYDLFSGTVTSLDYIVTNDWIFRNGFLGMQKEVAVG